MKESGIYKKKIGIYDYLIKEDERTSEGKYTGDKNKKGNPHGRGKMVYKDGRTYQGDWKDGKRSGEGSIEYNDGSEYDGEWEDDMPYGYGKGFINVEVKGVLCVYAGEFYNGVFHGKGSLGTGTPRNPMQLLSGNYGKIGDSKRSWYIGEREKGKMNGKGIRYFPGGHDSSVGYGIEGIRENDDLVDKKMSYQINYDAFEKEMNKKIKDKFVNEIYK